MELLMLIVVLLIRGDTMALWNDLNCPAPRAPENGLSFIFRNGELVHFRCHPGYFMSGKAVAHCVNSYWSASTPDCIPIQKGSLPENEAQSDTNYYSHQSNDQINKPSYNKIVSNDISREELNSKLFNWDSKPKKKGVYGDGPRRLPLINGIWPEKPIQIMSLGPQSTPGPMELVREEVNIAELRNRQHQEVAKQRYLDPNLDLITRKKNRRGNRKGRGKKRHQNSVLSSDFENRETVISLATTKDGDALSIAESKLSANETSRHKYRHQDVPRRKRNKGRKKKGQQGGYSTNLISRASRVDSTGPAYDPFKYHRNRHNRRNKMVEFRRKPVQEVTDDNLEFDTSCVESFYGRDLPMIAPYVPNAFVHRYETKKLPKYPFLSYMEVKYRCLSGYVLANETVHALRCREAEWVGEVPQCVESKTV